MAEIWRQLSSWFWQPYFWLPRGLQWEDLRPSATFQYPDYNDVWTYPFALAAVFLVFRSLIINPLILQPLAHKCGISSARTRPPASNEVLEKIFNLYKNKVPQNVITESSVSLKWHERQVERWLRRRYISSCPTKFDKFCDCGFQFLFHSVYFVMGWGVMYTKDWVWDISQCWENYPHHEIDSDVWWYYMTGLAFFWSSTAWSISEIGNSDNVKMYLHHLFTILLMTFSWTCNFTRIGSLVLLVHECADIPSLIAKMFLYAKIEKPVNPLFMIFMTMWIITRMGLYPFWILRSVFFEAYHYTWMPAAFVFYGLLTGLLVLNLLWTWIIIHVMIRKITAGKLEDIRSEDEHMSENSDEEIYSKKIE